MSKRPDAEDILEQNLVRRMTRRKVVEDIGRARRLYNPRAVSDRTQKKIENAVDEAEDAAIEWAGNHKWSIAGAASALLLFLGREPIRETVEKLRNKR